MSPLVADRVERPATLFGDAEGDHGGAGGSPTLDDVIAGAWEGLVARTAVTCLVCGSPMRPRAAGGSCEHCGSALG